MNMLMKQNITRMLDLHQLKIMKNHFNFVKLVGRVTFEINSCPIPSIYYSCVTVLMITNKLSIAHVQHARLYGMHSSKRMMRGNLRKCRATATVEMDDDVEIYCSIIVDCRYQIIFYTYYILYYVVQFSSI